MAAACLSVGLASSAAAQCLSPDPDGPADRAFQAAQMVLAAPPGIAIERNIAALAGQEDALRQLLTRRDMLRAPVEGGGQAIGDTVKREDALQDVERQITELAPGLLDELVTQPFDLSDVRQALSSREALLVLIDTGESGFAWMITQQCTSWARLDPALSGDRKSLISSLRESINPTAIVRGGKRAESGVTPQSGQTRRLLETLYKKLIAPFEDQIGDVDTLFVNGSSAFLGIPFAALIDPRDDSYLVEKHAIAVLPTLRTLKQAPMAGSSVGRDMEIVAIGAPRASLLPDGRTFPPLRAAQRELSGLGRDFGGNIRVLAGRDATTEKLRQALLDGPSDALLFATHTVLDGSGPDDVGLLMAGKDDSRIGTLLTLDDIAGLPLSGQLVILSACDTGSGPPEAQDALNGLALSFLRAGARDLVVTQWAISDRSAQLWSRSLLSNMENGEQNLPQAVRRSQLELLQMDGGRWSDPRYWAAYVPVLGGADR